MCVCACEVYAYVDIGFQYFLPLWFDMNKNGTNAILNNFHTEILWSRFTIIYYRWIYFIYKTCIFQKPKTWLCINIKSIIHKQLKQNKMWDGEQRQTYFFRVTISFLDCGKFSVLKFQCKTTFLALFTRVCDRIFWHIELIKKKNILKHLIPDFKKETKVFICINEDIY